MCSSFAPNVSAYFALMYVVLGVCVFTHDRCAGPFAIREHLVVRVASDVVVVHGSQLGFSGDLLLALALMEIVGVFVLGSVVINMPLALTQWNNWSFFFTFNAERGVGSGFWVLFPNLTPPQVNRINLIVLGSGVVAAWRAPVVVVQQQGVQSTIRAVDLFSA